MTATTSLPEKIDSLPDLPGVYLFKDVSGGVVYVGKAQSLRSRVRSYFGIGPTEGRTAVRPYMEASPELDPRKRLMVELIRDLDFVIAASEVEALVLEFSLIQKHRPRFNVRYRDDKSYPYIRIDLRDEYPTLCVIRQHAVARDGARYFGPYPSTRSMRETIRLARRIFGICQRLIISAKRRGGCTWTPAKGQRRRPCLDYYLGRCLGPCAGMVTVEQYRRAVKQVCDFLDGKYKHVVSQLRHEMEQASADMRFELAAKIRDQIEALEMTVSHQRVISPGGDDTDAVGYALQEDTGCLSVLQVREGRMVGQDHYLLEGVSGADASTVVNEFAKQHYQRVAAAPKEVLLPVTVEDGVALERLLAERRGNKVSLVAPKRGKKKALVAMAMENAEQQLRLVLERESAETRRGEEAVADLQKVLSLPMPPRRIEAFDISNVKGDQAVGSMIVFEDGHPRKSDYRRFRIRLGDGAPNDYEMMREVLLRRLRAAVSGNVKFQHLPDLVLVDGGAGQLGIALQAMEQLDLRMPAAGLAKEYEHVYLPGRAAPIELPSHSRALHLLQRVRDEAHRFAVTYHRSLREKRVRESMLDAIPGIGEARKQKLLRHFKTMSRLRAASAQEVSTVAGCGMDLAESVLRHLREIESD